MDTVSRLSEDHFQEIVVDSAILPEVAEARGYRTLTGTEEERAELEEFGFSAPIRDSDDTYPALLVPMRGADGSVRGVQLKPARPRVRTNAKGEPKPVKYETPKGASSVVDIPALSLERLREAPTTALWVTEGMKKVDALVSAGAACVGLQGVFNFRSQHGMLGDWEDVPIKGRPAVICFDADAQGNRMVQLAMGRLGAWLKTRGASVVHYVVVPPKVGETETKGVDDYLAAGGDLKGLFDVATQKAPGQDGADASFTDAYLVERVCSGALDNRFCWASGLGWLKWDGRVWTEVADTEPVEAVRIWALSQFEAVLADQRKEPSKNLTGLITGWRAVLAKTRIRALVDLSRGIVERYAGDFDADPDLLTCQNGTVHLPTGRLLPFDPAHSITLMAGAEYVPGARHPLWDKALSAIPAELHEWYRDRMGQALTGYKVPDHVMVLGYGSGSNGKSTIATTLRRAVGKYGVQVSDRILLANPGDHPTELMDLRGARYAVLEETPEARQLNVQRLKMVLGTEDITARRIRQDSVTFRTTHSLFVNSNYKPAVTETDHGTWRRLALLTFPYTFRKSAAKIASPMDRLGDPEMEYAHDNPGVCSAALAWMVEGATAWYGRGRRMLPMPDLIEEDTRQWRAETDLVMGFTDECLVLRPDAFTAAQEVLNSFNMWAGERGHRPWNDKTFASRFGSHDVIKGAKVSQGRRYVNGRQIRGWHGVEIRKEGDMSDPFEGGPMPEPPAPLPYEGSPSQITDTAQYDPEYLPDHPANTPPVVVGFDLEGASSSQLFVGGHEGPYVRLAGVVFGDGEDPRESLIEPYDHTPNTPLRRTLDALNSAGVIYGHNILGFDLLALARHHGADYDALAAKAVDTMVLARLIDPPGAKGMKPWGQAGYYGLDQVANRLGHAGKTDDLKALANEFGGFDRIPQDDPRYIAYLKGDLKATRHVYEELTSKGLSDYAKREMRVVALQNRMTLNGWKVDTALLAERVAGEAAKIEEAKAKLADYGMPLAKPDRFKLLPKAEWPEDYRISLSVAAAREGLAEDPERSMLAGLAKRIPGEVYASPWATDAGRDALVRAFQEAGAEHYPRTKTGALALSSDALGEDFWIDHLGKRRPGMLRVYGHIPAVRELCETLTLATGATAKYAEIQTWTTSEGRVHPRVTAPQASGRWATTEFASSNMGSRGEAGEQRAVLIAEPGHVLLTCDLSQVDMRAMAAMSQDTAYMKLFEPGRDAHMEMAEVYFGERTPEARRKTKAFNHAGNYGQGVRAVSERTGLPLDVCQRIADAKEEAFPRLAEYISEVRALAETGALLDNGFGRLMRPDPERAWTQAPALIGQGAARDIMCESLLRLVDMAPDVTPYLRGVVHDEVILSVPEEDFVYWATLVEQAFTWEWKGVPILCEVSNPALRWSDCQH